MTEDPTCIFCAIIAGQAPAYLVREDDATVSFLDINPATRGHTLVVPRRHVRTLLDIDLPTATELTAATLETARLLNDRLQPDGITLAQANEPAGWQTVFHIHVHLIPRWYDDGLVPPWIPTPADAEHLADTLAAIRQP